MFLSQIRLTMPGFTNIYSAQNPLGQIGHFKLSPGNFWVDTSFTLTWLYNLFDDHGCGCVMTCYNILRQWLLPGETCPGRGMRRGRQGVLVGNCDTYC